MVVVDRECHAHPGAPAVSRCLACLKPLCSECLSFDAYRPACATCGARQRAQRRRRTWIFAAVGMFALCAGTAALVGGVLFYEPPPPPFDYGRFGEDVRRLQSQLSQEPCDRAKIVELCDTMAKAGDYRGALVRAEAFFGACGNHDRLRWITYESHKRLGEWQAALDDATKLIESSPNDKDFWWWRGIVYEELNRLEEAAADYEKAIDAEPRLTNIPFNLATIYEKLGRHCDADRVITNYLKHYPEHASEPRVQQRLERLRSHCGNELVDL